MMLPSLPAIRPCGKYGLCGLTKTILASTDVTAIGRNIHVDAPAFNVSSGPA
jgi:hypothetical protein